MANQELKFLAQGLSRLNPTERLLKIVFNPFQRVLALSQELEFLAVWAFRAKFNPNSCYTKTQSGVATLCF